MQMFRDHCYSLDFIHLNSSVPLHRTPDFTLLVLSNYILYSSFYTVPVSCETLVSLSSAFELLYILIYD